MAIEARDELFLAEDPVSDFVFDADVADVFDDMVRRSVPLYAEVQRIVVELVARLLATPEVEAEGDGAAPGAVYDVGCSTGTTLAAIARALGPDRRVALIGIEPSPGMREAAAEKLAALDGAGGVEFLPDPIESLERLPGARAITMLYTLQFVRPPARLDVLGTCWRSLAPGGCLVLAEKILAEDRVLRRLFIDLYHDYKRRHGYSSTEITRKREALENVLVPYTAGENAALLRRAGFARVEQVFQWYNFAAFVAVKR
jgi:tRNA (cmo5U34)-methyltransferase